MIMLDDDDDNDRRDCLVSPAAVEQQAQFSSPIAAKVDANQISLPRVFCLRRQGRATRRNPRFALADDNFAQARHVAAW